MGIVPRCPQTRRGRCGYHAAVTDRAPLPVEGAGTCPFLGLDADRDLQAKVPDRRHRCYAEIAAAPRAMAHQQHYCLTPSFPACPTFQDWARREAARLAALTAGSADRRGPGEDQERAPDGAEATRGETEAAGLWDTEPPAGARARDWTAPPPWIEATEPERTARPSAAATTAGIGAAGVAAVGTGTGEAAGAAGVGAAGSSVGAPPGATTPGAPAPLQARSSAAAATRPVADQDEDVAPPPFLADRPPTPRAAPGTTGPAAVPLPSDAASSRPNQASSGVAAGAAAGVSAAGASAASASSSGGIAGARPAAPRARPRQTRDASTPAWEAPRRVEAYPSLRTRVGFPDVPRLGIYAAALAIAALALFLLPTFFAGGGSSGPRATAVATSNASPSATPAPTPIPVATPQVYVVVAGDTLSRIAARFGTTVAAIMKANPQMKNPDSLQIGDQVTIPSKRVATLAPPTQAPAGSSGPGNPAASAAP